MSEIVSGLPSPGALKDVRPENLFLIPTGFTRGESAMALRKAGHALSILRDDLAFTSIEIVVWGEASFDRYAAAVVAFEPWRHVLPGPHKAYLENLVDRLAAPRASFAGVPMNTPKVMGIVNVTPDSFSDGGDFENTQAAIDHAIALTEAGADILDIGGESTRPGAEPVPPNVEQSRVIPVIKALADRGLKVSADTRHASTMGAALEAGASIVNDITALSGDPDALSVVAKHRAPVILMHMQGQPQTMQTEPTYQWAPVDVYRMLKARVEVCVEAGIQLGSICVDPGIGFGKDDSHNLSLLDNLAVFHGFGCPVMLGASRKSFIDRLCDAPDPKDRIGGSIASALAGVAQGVQLLRVHDVAETKQAITVTNSVSRQTTAI